SAQYNNALRTTSPLAMMVIAITRTRQHLRAAKQHREEKRFDLERQEKSIVVNRLRALQAIVSPKSAPELSRDLYAFYARMIKLLARNGRKTPLEERYEIVDRNLETLAKQWESFKSVNSQAAGPQQVRGTRHIVEQVL
ncbi:flagellar protein FliS, partial [Thalassospira sp.]